MDVKVVTVGLDELQVLLDRMLDEKLIPLIATINTGDELGEVGGWELVVKTCENINTEKTVKKMAAKRHTSEGIPCVIGRKNRFVFSSVALKLWEMGKDCSELTAWLQEKLNII